SALPTGGTDQAVAISLFPAAERRRPRSPPEHAGAGIAPQAQTPETAPPAPPPFPSASHPRCSPPGNDEPDEKPVPPPGGPVSGHARLAALPRVPAVDRRRHEQESRGRVAPLARHAAAGLGAVHR